MIFNIKKELEYERIYYGTNNIICRVFTNNFKKIIYEAGG